MVRYIVPELDSSIALSAVQIITPNKVVANHVRKLIGSNLKISHYSLESLAQNIVRRQGIGIASVLLSRRLLQNAVREVIATADVEGTARAFLGTVKDLFRSGVDLAVLRQSPDLRIQQLGKLAIAYQQQLRQNRKIDSAELYWQGKQTVNYQKAYLFYGYFLPSQAELNLINAIAGQGSILVLPQDDLLIQQGIEYLQSQGMGDKGTRSPKRHCTPKGIQATHNEETKGQGDQETRRQGDSINKQLQACFRQSANLPEQVWLHTFADLDAEVRGVLTQVKILLTKGIRAKDIVLVAKDEQLYGEALIDLAWEYDLPLQVSHEIPIEQTRLGTWLKLLLEVIRDNFPFEATAKLLSHPLSGYMSPDIWSLARAKHVTGCDRWQELGVDLSLLDLNQNSYSREFWLKRLQLILSTWDVLEKGKAWAKEAVAYYRLQEALSELTQPSTQQLSKQGFLAEISEILALLTIPSQPGTGGIELHSPNNLLGTSYDYVFILGAREGIIPKAIADDSILDFHSRKQLAKQGIKIETAVDLAQRETWEFYCLLDVPSYSLTFSYPELCDRNPTLPSPFLSRIGLQPTAIVLPIASRELARQEYLRQPNLLDKQTQSWLLFPQITQAWQVEISRQQDTANEYGGATGMAINPDSKIFSASQLTQLGQCPFKWFSARLLKLKELPEAELDLEAAVRGNLYHRTLELSLANIKTASDLAKFNQAQLAKAFTQAETELNLSQLPSWEAQRQEHLQLLTLNLAAAEFLPADREVIARETKFTMNWHGLQIRGQVDRIDRTPAGLAVIDYKSSSVTPPGVKDDRGKASIDIQLAVYQDAIALQYPDDAIDTAIYYSISQRKTISRPIKEPAELAAFAERVKIHLQQGYYPVAPDIDQKACRYCSYDLVCRKKRST